MCFHVVCITVCIQNRRPGVGMIDLCRCLAQRDKLCRYEYLMSRVPDELQSADGWLGTIGNWMQGHVSLLLVTSSAGGML